MRIAVIGLVAIGGWFFFAFYVFNNPRNIALEIANNGVEPRAVDIAIGAPIPLIPDVTLNITNIRWTSSLVVSRPATYQSGITISGSRYRGQALPVR